MNCKVESIKKHDLNLTILKMRLSYGTITLIRMDDYYKTFPNIPVDERGNKNFDHPDSYDTPLLVSDLKKLQQGLPIEKPIYDFSIKFFRIFRKK